MTLPPPLLPHHRMPEAPLPPAGSIGGSFSGFNFCSKMSHAAGGTPSSRGGLFAQRACVVRSLADRLNQSPAIRFHPSRCFCCQPVSEPTVTMATASTTTQPHPRNRSTHPTRRLGRLATGQLSRRLWSGCGCLLKPLLTRPPTRGKDRDVADCLLSGRCSPSPCRSCPTCRRVRSIRLVDKRTISRSAGWSELF
uniref:Uncharacterized protein n=1 Tax=Macrostomum lignano TaxID=282301 RepID=A0A1I8JL54_9PLAT